MEIEGNAIMEMERRGDARRPDGNSPRSLPASACDVKAGWCVCGEFHRPSAPKKAERSVPPSLEKVCIQVTKERPGWRSVRELKRRLNATRSAP